MRGWLSQGVEQLTIQAGAQGINLTYVVNFSGKWVVGIEDRVSVGVEGIAGQLQVSSSGGEETESSPHGVATPGPSTLLSRFRALIGAAFGLNAPTTTA